MHCDARLRSLIPQANNIHVQSDNSYGQESSDSFLIWVPVLKKVKCRYAIVIYNRFIVCLGFTCRYESASYAGCCEPWLIRQQSGLDLGARMDHLPNWTYHDRRWFLACTVRQRPLACSIKQQYLLLYIRIVLNLLQIILPGAFVHRLQYIAVERLQTSPSQCEPIARGFFLAICHL